MTEKNFDVVAARRFSWASHMPHSKHCFFRLRCRHSTKSDLSAGSYVFSAKRHGKNSPLASTSPYYHFKARLNYSKLVASYVLRQQAPQRLDCRHLPSGAIATQGRHQAAIESGCRIWKSMDSEMYVKNVMNVKMIQLCIYKQNGSHPKKQFVHPAHHLACRFSIPGAAAGACELHSCFCFGRMY